MSAAPQHRGGAAPKRGSFPDHANATDTTTNLGPGSAPAATTRYYLSLNKQKSGEDTLLTGSRVAAGLAAGRGDASGGIDDARVPAYGDRREE
jgi:hypothetical protein